MMEPRVRVVCVVKMILTAPGKNLKELNIREMFNSILFERIKTFFFFFSSLLLLVVYFVIYKILIMNIFTVTISMIVKYWAVTNMWLIANHGCSQ